MQYELNLHTSRACVFTDTRNMTKVAAGLECPAGKVWSYACKTGTAAHLLPHSLLGACEAMVS